MIRSHEFEFHIYDDRAEGHWVEVRPFEDKVAAKRAGGSYCKKTGGPVDIAYAGSEPWEERYITTAFPSEYHSKRYQFEYLGG